ncbi:2-oxoglutarate dehydrogenase E1 component [Ahrensia sp. R2A130]|uniref:2-oxoglutarate dehydrogenase E1 component n=1 Tax=Ahrensia sp. R2A130 TaxID=744979 RepID=UPI0001E0842E|nr:2-oxoglutarate dehydrogenase E1 component [Ahrensia sp. R2A130]EFL88073.1 oxoglutarate dehydrogenase (succinyl-transferring), E1 component [Ahrensia sp. R2A130]
MAREAANEAFANSSFLFGSNAGYIEELYAQWQDDPAGVTGEWQEFFSSLGDDAADVLKNAEGASWKKSHWPIHANGELVSALDGHWADDDVPSDKKVADRLAAATGKAASSEDVQQQTRDSIRAIMMVRAYRMRGHLHANLDPLGIAGPKDDHNELHPSAYGFTEADYDREIFLDHVLGLEFATIPQMLEILKRTYCSTLGTEFMHISNPDEKSWIQQRIEGPDKSIEFTENGKKAILNKLVEAEGFEKFLDVKYKGTKRFGLDGGESLIPALEQIIKRGGQLGLQDIILGMPHRGRLNVLTNVMGKPLRAVFHEFMGGSFKPEAVEGSGDVKYHLGASSDREFDGNNVHLSLTANPSHLEIVNPVVLGKARAKQDQLRPKREDGTRDRSTVLPLLLHGDAAFAGQGVVAECLGLSGLKGHITGGSIHVIVNNQIGFTTNPRFSRSSPYPSDVAKMIEAPIFHVNGDDPEAVTYAAKIAIEFRQKFGKPVVIDMFCYRRFGHNEGDEPSFTQPIMYRKIKDHRSTLTLYGERLQKEGVIGEGAIDEMRAEFRAMVDTEFDNADGYKPNKADWLDGAWSGMKAAERTDDPRRGATGITMDRLRDLGAQITKIPDEFEAHKTIKRFMGNRAKMIDTGEGIDWATAEALAFGSLQRDGHKVRLSGQDCERGTFSQRHSVLYDQRNENRYIPLDNLTPAPADQGGADTVAGYEVINSMLSEEAVLGYEYGYSLAEPSALVIWEAQFGDFVNGAQVVIDQFISSGERKWLRMCGLVMLLPHGYEGQGPEHSSARVERFLQQCAEDNMQVANCTTPANYFHILRRQMKREFRKPLIMFTPKSLLRAKRAVSKLEEFGDDSSFHRLLWDDAEANPDAGEIKLVADDKIRRVVICTGKVYYDLYEEREKRGINDIYLLRMEQLYPFPKKALTTELARFKGAEMVWCQEEPRNMGAWEYANPRLEKVLVDIGASHTRPRYTGRKGAASPATGQMSLHLKQLAEFLEDALG